MRILVTGSTGTVGRELVRLLDARGVSVRAMTRDPVRAALPAGVDVQRGDFDDAASLADAMAGASAVFLVGLLPRHDLAAVAAARAAAIDRLVKLSVITADLPDLGATHRPGEEALRSSGLAWTILRPTTFATNTLAWAEAVRRGDAVPNPFGEGAQGIIDPRDIAAVAVEALTSAEHSGQTYTLTGPELLTVRDQAATVAAAIGRKVAVRDLSLDEWRDQLQASSIEEEYADLVVAGTRFAREGRNAVITGDVERVTGVPPRTYRTWVEDHRTAFL